MGWERRLNKKRSEKDMNERERQMETDRKRVRHKDGSDREKVGVKSRSSERGTS